MSKYRVIFKKVVDVEADDDVEAEEIATQELEDETNNFECGAQSLDITVRKIKEE